MVDNVEDFIFGNPGLIRMLEHEGKPSDFYGQNVAVCALAGSLIIAGTITFFLPKNCDLSHRPDVPPVADKPANQPS